MNILKIIFTKQLQEHLPVISLLLVSFILLSCRIFITKTTYFLFLVWNVILAGIPYLITLYLSEKKDLNRIVFIIALIIWLLFLPNAPYIITDLYHLKRSVDHLIWLDTLVIFMFAITGLILFYNSLKQMLKIIKKQHKIKHESLVVTIICFTSSFGIYIGRFMRYNSWDVVSNPKPLTTAIFSVISNPVTHTTAWLFTIFFGLVLSLSYYIFQNLFQTYKTN